MTTSHGDRDGHETLISDARLRNMLRASDARQWTRERRGSFYAGVFEDGNCIANAYGGRERYARAELMRLAPELAREVMRLRKALRAATRPRPAKRKVVRRG